MYHRYIYTLFLMDSDSIQIWSPKHTVTSVVMHAKTYLHFVILMLSITVAFWHCVSMQGRSDFHCFSHLHNKLSDALLTDEQI